MMSLFACFGASAPPRQSSRRDAPPPPSPDKGTASPSPTKATKGHAAIEFQASSNSSSLAIAPSSPAASKSRCAQQTGFAYNGLQQQNGGRSECSQSGSLSPFTSSEQGGSISMTVQTSGDLRVVDEQSQQQQQQQQPKPSSSPFIPDSTPSLHTASSRPSIEFDMEHFRSARHSTDSKASEPAASRGPSSSSLHMPRTSLQLVRGPACSTGLGRKPVVSVVRPLGATDLLRLHSVVMQQYRMQVDINMTEERQRVHKSRSMRNVVTSPPAMNPRSLPMGGMDLEQMRLTRPRSAQSAALLRTSLKKCAEAPGF